MFWILPNQLAWKIHTPPNNHLCLSHSKYKTPRIKFPDRIQICKLNIHPGNIPTSETAIPPFKSRRLKGVRMVRNTITTNRFRTTDHWHFLPPLPNKMAASLMFFQSRLSFSNRITDPTISIYLQMSYQKYRIE